MSKEHTVLEGLPVIPEFLVPKDSGFELSQLPITEAHRIANEILFIRRYGFQAFQTPYGRQNHLYLERIANHFKTNEYAGAGKKLEELPNTQPLETTLSQQSDANAFDTIINLFNQQFKDLLYRTRYSTALDWASSKGSYGNQYIPEKIAILTFTDAPYSFTLTQGASRDPMLILNRFVDQSAVDEYASLVKQHGAAALNAILLIVSSPPFNPLQMDKKNEERLRQTIWIKRSPGLPPNLIQTEIITTSTASISEKSIVPSTLSSREATVNVLEQAKAERGNKLK